MTLTFVPPERVFMAKAELLEKNRTKKLRSRKAQSLRVGAAIRLPPIQPNLRQRTRRCCAGWLLSLNGKRSQKLPDEKLLSIREEAHRKPNTTPLHGSVCAGAYIRGPSYSSRTERRGKYQDAKTLKRTNWLAGRLW